MFRSRTLAPTVLAVFGLALVFLSYASAQEVKGQAKIGISKITLAKGKLYQITLDGPQQVFVIVDPTQGNLTRVFTKDFKEKMYFVPAKNEEYTFLVTPNLGAQGKDGVIDYTLKFKAMSFADKPLVEDKNKLTNDDAKYKPPPGSFGPENRPFKDYKVPMKAGQMYVIDMVRSQIDIDPYLFLEDSTGKIVAQDDDGGGNLNARIIFQAQKDGEYRVIATTLIPATGEYTLTVRAIKE
jgi:hypothetical protein